jgi:hypothetical protein
VSTADFRLWHETDMSGWSPNVCCWGNNRFPSLPHDPSAKVILPFLLGFYAIWFAAVMLLGSSRRSRPGGGRTPLGGIADRRDDR